MLFIFFFWAVGKNSLRKEIEFKIALAWKPKTWLLLLDFRPVLPIIASVFHIQNKTWKPEMYVKVFCQIWIRRQKCIFVGKYDSFGGLPSWLSGKESPCQETQEIQIQSLGQEDPQKKDLRILSNPLQYSCLRNSMARGAWWATVLGVAENRTQLSD